MTPRFRLFLLACLAGTLLAAEPAAATPKTLTFTYGPVAIAGYSVAQTTEFPVPSPADDGYIVRMEADLVDAAGNVVTDDRTMLHHAAFVKLGVPDYACPNLTGPIKAERFYASGEERNVLALPPSFGYLNRAADRWALVYMLMNHRARPDQVWIRYRIDYETEQELTAVRPIWLDAAGCKPGSEFDVPGGAPRGSVHRRSWEFTMPESGLLVAGGGHVHGGGVALELANATCGRSLFTSEPQWAALGTDEYAIRPLLHEPGPVHMSGFLTGSGIPVSAGDVLRLTAVYENSLPHSRAMGIMLVALVPAAVEPCGALPELTVDRGEPAWPPRFVLPLPREPEGKVVRDPKRPVIVTEFSLGPERISLRRGATLRWRFAGALEHNVTVVTGPVGFSSPSTRGGVFSYRFRRPGVYKIFCSLHPAQMTQIVTVR